MRWQTSCTIRLIAPVNWTLPVEKVFYKFAKKQTVMEDNTLFQGSDVFIIGNGFDLDLGLKTSYHDFYLSDDWPFKKPNTLMGAFLQHEGCKKRIKPSQSKR